MEIKVCRCGAVARPNQRNCLACHAESQRQYRKRRVVSYSQRMKESARSKAGMKYRRGGLLRKPCEVCGSPDSQKHHDDYTKPYDVRWLCREHHLAHHAQEKKAAIKELSEMVKKYTRLLWV